jgi:hypothetical protein
MWETYVISSARARVLRTHTCTTCHCPFMPCTLCTLFCWYTVGVITYCLFPDGTLIATGNIFPHLVPYSLSVCFRVPLLIQEVTVDKSNLASVTSAPAKVMTKNRTLILNEPCIRSKRALQARLHAQERRMRPVSRIKGP